MNQITANANLLQILERIPGCNVWVVGDLMVDEYLTGSVERISPEAPVPVVRVKGSEHRLGGAANVARQLAALGARVRLGGVVGADEAGAQLLALCGAAGIDSAAVVALPGRATTRKLRVLAPSQQLLRLDWEDSAPIATAASQTLLARLEAGPAPEAVILSDYAKGVITPATVAAIRRAVGEKVHLLADPKRRQFADYRGASVITPNLAELAAATGCALDPDNTVAIVDAARQQARAAGAEALVVTLGVRGMLVVPVHGPHVSIPAVRRSVFDVTGAGDTAIAVLALALTSGATLTEAAQLANAAAGLAVAEVGTAAVPLGSIRQALHEAPVIKVVSREELAARAERWRMEGARVVFTNGCFDLLHAGHLALLNEAARLGDVLVVGINSDASVKRMKGEDRPLVPQAERCALLAALACVDAVTVFDEDTPLETLRAVRPDVLVKGRDYRLEDVIGRELVEAGGGRVALVELVRQKSTTALVERISKPGERKTGRRSSG
jgi:D-beta-D-heptose 7-phosphate kinase/D-beta-D-heptose 1-phosphate adenosyltransferase